MAAKLPTNTGLTKRGANKMKILNLYAGIGGNRKRWNGEKHSITAVENNPEIAAEYRKHFPNDKVIVEDAHKFLKENHEDYDFIWASPPCPTHSSIRKAGSKNGQYQEKYPDMNLYEEIIFLKYFFNGDWVVENVDPYYRSDIQYKRSDLLIQPQDRARHVFWSNFTIPQIEVPNQAIHQGNNKSWREYIGLDIKENWSSVEQRKVLRNAVHPKIGEVILHSRNLKQSTLEVKA